MHTTISKNELRKKIIFKVLTRFILAFVFIGLLIFIPAGTMNFFNGWLFIMGIFVPMSFTMIFFYISDPELLEKRINLKEKETAQRKYIRLSFLLYIIAYIIPGLDFRFNWSYVPRWIVLLSLVVMIFGYIMFITVMLQNRYASRVIEIQDQQKLIDSGLYSVVRHPMYLSALILFMSSAMVLGSYFTLIPMLLLPLLLAFRINNEEKVLLAGLPGYEDYIKRVKFRLVPFIW